MGGTNVSDVQYAPGAYAKVHATFTEEQQAGQATRGRPSRSLVAQQWRGWNGVSRSQMPREEREPSILVGVVSAGVGDTGTLGWRRSERRLTTGEVVEPEASALLFALWAKKSVAAQNIEIVSFSRNLH